MDTVMVDVRGKLTIVDQTTAVAKLIKKYEKIQYQLPMN